MTGLNVDSSALAGMTEGQGMSSPEGSGYTVRCDIEHGTADVEGQILQFVQNDSGGRFVQNDNGDSCARKDDS